ncbi:MAG: 4Fe-4S binding protein [Acidimicrobiales bacterium]
MAVFDEERQLLASPGRSPEETTSVEDPIAVAVHLRPARRHGIDSHFAPTDPDPRLDVTEMRHIGAPLKRLLKSRKFQFFLILPNQLIFWIVIATGIWGVTDPGRNFGPAITWYLWFCLVFVMMAVVGRAWCSMCPFGGFGEWVQRKALFKRAQKALGLGWKLPERWAGHGLVLSVVAFVILTFIEEYANIAGPGAPIATSIMVLGIVTFALLSFLVFERRTFCRYLCPLSSLIGSVGSLGMVAGFRSKSRSVCLECNTKDCMRGSEDGYGCPWYTWPGSADSNALCGLCTECYKSCPSDNIGLFVQKPLTSVIAPVRRRADIGVAVAVLFGLVAYQQYNAFGWYANVDNWLNNHLHFPHYPDPVAYLGGITLGALVLFGAAMLLRAIAKPRDEASGVTFWFTTFAYAMIPVTGADYLARQLPKFFKYVLRVPSTIVSPLGIHLGVFNTRLLSDPWIVTVQVAIMGLGTAASLYAMHRISQRDFLPTTTRPLTLYISGLTTVLVLSGVVSVMYIAMQAAN